MNTVKKYTLRTCSNKPNHVILNEYAKEKGHTDSMDIYSNDSHDSKFTDSQGLIHYVGKRLTADRKNRVEIEIINSYQKTQADIKEKLITINND